MADAPSNTAPPILDLSGAPERPLVKLPAGDYRLRTPDELTFEEFGFQISAGRRMVELSDSASDPQVLAELQDLVASAARLLLVDLDDDAAGSITPGQFLRISSFFKSLVAEAETPASTTESSTPQGASDSTEASAAA